MLFSVSGYVPDGGAGHNKMLKYTGMLSWKGPTLKSTLLCKRVYISDISPKKIKGSTFQASYSVKGSTFQTILPKIFQKGLHFKHFTLWKGLNFRHFTL